MERMGNETKTNGGAASMAGGGEFRAKMEHYVYSGDKKHVIAGIGIFAVIFGVPWYLMNQGSKHQSHQDYMDKADELGKHASRRLRHLTSSVHLKNLVTYRLCE